MPVAELTQPDLIRMISGTSVERFQRHSPRRRRTGAAHQGREPTQAPTRTSTSRCTPGEVVGLTGLEGSGPGELARGLYALEALGDGEVTTRR